MRVLFLAGLLSLLAILQIPAEKLLARSRSEFPHGFTAVFSIREYSDGRVLVVDLRDATVLLLDFERKTSTPVGRSGAGPGEYKSPFTLLPLRGDSTLLIDTGLRRSIVIGPAGVAGDVFLTSDEIVSVPAGARTPQAIDARGRIYFLGSALATERSVPTVLDSVPLLRYDRRLKRVDTLARLRQPRRAMKVDRQGEKVRSVSIRKVPFASHDDWAVFPDGRVVIARTDEYRLDWLGADEAQLHNGPRITYQPVLVVDADRKGAVDELPKVKPPFDGPSTLAGPDGKAWVRRTNAAGDSAGRYDVLDQSGRLIARVALPLRTRIVGFGREWIYMVRTDEDDLEYLGRVPLPRL